MSDLKELKVVAVDDDELQLNVINAFVQKTSFLNLDKSFHKPLQALDYIISSDPDLLLLDIEMPDISGFDLIKSLTKVPQIILITGKKEFALDAFKFNVVDYLLKPINDYARFLQAVSKAKSALKGNTTNHISDKIYVREGSLLVGIKLNEIRFFEAYGDYVKVITDQKIYVVYSTLSKIEKRLPDDFFKVHRSYVVRLDSILNIDQSNIQVGEKIIPVSQSIRPILLSLINTI